jgi:carbamoyl-phosphate synthase large subunit
VLAGFNEPDLLIRLHVLGESIERNFAYAHGTLVRGLSELFYPDGDGDGGP